MGRSILEQGFGLPAYIFPFPECFVVLLRDKRVERAMANFYVDECDRYKAALCPKRNLRRNTI